MNRIKQIAKQDAQTQLREAKAVFVDIRDPRSFEEDHVPGAIHLSDANVESFLREADKAKTTIVYCYHGISSQGAAEYLQEKGFSDVFSLIGGFEEWRRD